MHLHKYFKYFRYSFVLLSPLFAAGFSLFLESCKFNGSLAPVAELDVLAACKNQTDVGICNLIRRISLSKDENTLLSIHEDHSARSWNLTTNTLIGLFGNQPIFDAQYTEDGTSIVAITKDNIQIWEASGSKLIAETTHCSQTLLPSENYQFDFQMLGEHQVLVAVFNQASENNCLAMIDLPSATKQFEIVGQQNPIVMSDRSRILTFDVEKGGIHAWNLSPGIPPVDQSLFGTKETALFLSPDEKIVLSVSQASAQSTPMLERWNLETKMLLTTLPVNDTLKLSPDKKRFFATPLSSQELTPSKLWDAEVLFNTGKINEITTLSGYLFEYVFFSPDGRRAFTNLLENKQDHVDYVGQVFDPTTGENSASLFQCPRTNSIYDAPRTMAFSSDGTQLYMRSCYSLNIQLWDMTGLL